MTCSRGTRSPWSWTADGGAARFRACVFGVALLAACAIARAQDEGGDPVVQASTGLMTEVPLLPEQIKRSFSILRTVPFKDSALALRLIASNDWDWVAADTKARSSPDRLVPLGALHTPNWDPDRALITLGYTMVQRAVDLEDWLAVYAMRNGFRVLFGQVGTLYGKPLAEVVAERREDGKPWVYRLTAVRDGGRLLVMESGTGATAFVKHAPVFAMAAASLRFEEAAPVLGTEASESLVVSSPFRLALRRPAAWAHAEESNDPLGCQIVHLYNQGPDGVLGGYVTVRAFERERFPDVTVKRVAQEFVKSLLDLGVRLRPFPASGLPEADARVFDRDRVSEEYASEDSRATGVSLVAFSNARLVVLVAMVTPGISASESLWLMNRQAFRQAVESLQVE